MLTQQIVDTINKYQMLKPGERVVIAVSGGADSVALFYSLLEIQATWELKLHIAHLNHMFRRKDAAKDADFVRKLATKHDLSYSIESFDVPAYQRKHKLSPQDAARRIRYRFLDRVAEEAGADKIALGHTADDQAETILMRIIQGTGLQGLQGIPPRRENYIRPLIETSRKQIEAYLSQKGVSYRQDISNLNPKYLRNKIRLELIPLLEREYNPGLCDALNQLSQILQAEDEWLHEYLKQILPEIVKHTPQAVYIKLDAYNLQPLAIKRHILRWAINKVKGDLKQISFSHIEQLLHLTSFDLGHKVVHLPQQVVAKKGYQGLEITRPTEPITPLYYDYPLTVPGITAIPPLHMEIEAKIVERTEITIYPKGNQAGFDWDRIKKPLTIRNRKPGDSFYPLGMKGEKKLKDFFIDCKIPLSLRNRIPLVVCGSDILWVAGWRINERYKIDSDTKLALCLNIKETCSDAT